MLPASKTVNEPSSIETSSELSFDVKIIINARLFGYSASLKENARGLEAFQAENSTDQLGYVFRQAGTQMWNSSLE